MAEQRDETHVEQHGDGDVNVTAPSETGGEEPSQQPGTEPADAPPGGDEGSSKAEPEQG